jgi:hypothetical protein
VPKRGRGVTPVSPKTSSARQTGSVSEGIGCLSLPLCTPPTTPTRKLSLLPPGTYCAWSREPRALIPNAVIGRVPGRVIIGGEGNTNARTVGIRNGEAINTRALTQYPVTVMPVPGGVAVVFLRRNP